MPQSFCIIIPAYNHAKALPHTLNSIKDYNLPCFLIDDGSTDGLSEASSALKEIYPRLEIFREPVNQGKGAALARGFKLVWERGFSHAITIDADGQHNAESIKEFIALSKIKPEALILGLPVFGKDAPLSRRLGRELSNILCWAETLSFAARDALCGLRLYPLEAALQALEDTRSKRMEFDSEILVRIIWLGTQVINVRTKVSYPVDGASHFNYFTDNLRIIKFHISLVPDFIKKLPALIIRRFIRPK